MAWISFRKVSKVYTLFALISMFIRQRKIAGRDHGVGGGGGVVEVARRWVILSTSSQGN